MKYVRRISGLTPKLVFCFCRFATNIALKEVITHFDNPLPIGLYKEVNINVNKYIIAIFKNAYPKFNIRFNLRFQMFYINNHP